MKRVLVCSPLTLVGQGIVSLLRGDQSIEVVGCETDPDVALQRIREVRPDVVILGSEEATAAPSSLVVRLWQEGCGARIIELSLSGRMMSVYQAEQALVTDTSDLLKAIDVPPVFAASNSNDDLV